jgi:hypothetical protein
MLNTRTILWLALGAMLFLNYEAWMKDYPALSANPALTGTGAPNTLGNTLPQAADGAPPASADESRSRQPRRRWATAAPAAAVAPADRHRFGYGHPRAGNARCMS